MNIKIFTRFLAATITATALLLLMVCFQVRQTEQAIITRFGEPRRTLSEPGLYMKWPWPIEQVNRIDTRLNFHELRLSETLTRDRRNLIIPVFVAWRIFDPLKFMEAAGSMENVQGKLDSLVSGAENAILGQYEFKQLISTDPGTVKLREIEEKIMQTVSVKAEFSFGIRVEQIGIERVTLPMANIGAVFERMKAEREQFAAKFRAEGRREADAIRVKTDTRRTTLLAEAQRYANARRGEAEAAATRIYSQAHGRNPEFYLFLREVETLKRTLSQNTTLVLDAGAPPFHLLKSDEP